MVGIKEIVFLCKINFKKIDLHDSKILGKQNVEYNLSVKNKLFINTC